ncbi:MAG: tetratricopeptide repeat protein [Betaproteobacteria bacterium]
MSTPRPPRASVSGGARTALAGLTMMAIGCASAPSDRDATGITLDELRAGAPLGVEQGKAALVDEGAVLAVSAEMQDFLNAHVARGADRAVRLRQLAYAIVDESRFGLKYDETTRTASETFRTRRGNCLSFSNMFVAMARRAGLDVAFQEVDVPPDWSFENDTFVLNRHVDVVVDLGKDGEHVVDFNMDDFRTTYDRRRISDARALAHFYNNLAVERMQAGDTASALLYFRRATGHDASFSPAWTNLGILYLRKGHPHHAEAACLQALRADEGDLVAMSNLASLYERQGDEARAVRYRSRVRDHRQRNPYYRFQLAREAFLARDYDAAIGHLTYAIRKKKNEDQFYYLLGLCHLKKGEEQVARRWLSRAEEVAATDALKRRYASKVDILLSAPPGQDKP